jgi:hypothetical protein
VSETFTFAPRYSSRTGTFAVMDGVIWFAIIGVAIMAIAIVAARAVGRREEAELDRLGISDDPKMNDR